LEQTKSLTLKSANFHSDEESNASSPHLGHLTIVRPCLIVSKTEDKIFEEELIALSSLVWSKLLSVLVYGAPNILGN
jgi:hypothetical protein